MKFITQSKINQKIRTEKSSDELITIPNQALTPKEILMLYQTGRSGELPNFRPAYADDEKTGRFIPDLTKMDKIEREEYYKGVLSELKETREKHSKYQQDLEQEKALIESMNRADMERELRAEENQK